MDSLSHQLKLDFPGRSYQIDRLFGLYGHPNEPLVSNVFIYGPSSTGKSAIVSSLLDGLHIRNASVNLIECFSSKVLFESILNQLSGHTMDPFKGQPYAKCDTMMEFVSGLQRCAKEGVDLKRSVIVFDKAERLRNMDFNLLPGFLKLKELTGLSISAIFISEIVFEKYYTKARNVAPIKIHFPQYTKEELLEILRLDFNHMRDIVWNNFREDLNIAEDFYSNYLNLFLSVFYLVCRDLSELRHMSRVNFVKYCAPIYKKECKMEDSMGLWRRIAPILKASLDVLYLRISPVNRERTQQRVDIKQDETRLAKQFACGREGLNQSLELPFYGKYLLIAAYLASYNPAKEDKKLFMKQHGKKRKTLRDVRAKQGVSEQMNTQLGPKAFGFERLVAIFYAILDEKVDFNSNLLVQISTLVELQLLSLVSDNCDLDGRKYKCCVGLELIQIISKTVEFDITKYLVDFN